MRYSINPVSAAKENDIDMDRDTFEKKVDFKTQMYKKKVGFNTYLKRPTHEPGISCQQAILQEAKKPFDGMESTAV